MPESLPSTASLQAFAEVARTRSFKDAAARLHVSPSAVSRQVQSLEAELGVRLFVRRNPGLELTAVGSRYLTTVERILRDLRDAGQAISPTSSKPLRVSALESFTAKWLVPHLPSFEAEHPGARIEIEATLEYADFDRDPIDVAIRFGVGPWDGLHAEPIVDLHFFPVCSPALLEGEAPLREPADLAAQTWIHVSQVPNAWRDWARSIGLADLSPVRDLHFDHVGIALSAAETGQGVVLSSPLLCGPELQAERLCRPFDLPVRSAETYHLVCRPEGLEDDRIIAFRDWLVESLANL